MKLLVMLFILKNFKEDFIADLMKFIITSLKVIGYFSILFWFVLLAHQYYRAILLIMVCQVALTLSWRRPLSYRNQSINLLCKSMDWFLYDNVLRHERVKECSSNSVQVVFFKILEDSQENICAGVC